MVAPEWWRTVSPPDWQDRSARRVEDDRRPATPAARATLALTIGKEGWSRLAAIDHGQAPPWLRPMPAVAIRRRVWGHNDLWDGTPLPWRAADTIPPAAPCISSPADVDAHDARQPSPPWVGYQLQITATCEDALPHLIPHVDTMSGPTADGTAMPKSQAALQQRGLLPGTHRVDTGLLDAARLVASRDSDGVALWGPTRQDSHWQAREGAGCDAQHCRIDGAQPHATGPAGQVSTGWTPALETRGNPVIQVTCATTDGRPCEP
jgi:hypothetical protein